MEVPWFEMVSQLPLLYHDIAALKTMFNSLATGNTPYGVVENLNLLKTPRFYACRLHGEQ